MAEHRFAVVGDPVAHSRSPVIHEALLDLTGLDGHYLAIRSDTEGLRSLIEQLRHGEWTGLNVTMPLKAEAAEQADELTADAGRAGSVNTLLMRGESVLGDTTDCAAFRQLFDDQRLADRSSVLILGAGGSAAAALTAIGADDRVYVSSRREDRSCAIANRLGGEVVAWRSAVAGALVINATPLGMRSETLPAGILEVASGVIDLPYGPEPTPTVTDALALKIPVVDGHEFLIRQAIASFTLWTGLGVPYEQVAAALRKL